MYQVLVVDDDVNVRTTVEIMLENPVIAWSRPIPAPGHWN